MCRWFIIAVFTLVVLALPSAWAQSSDTWLGTWKLNVAKSKSSPGPPAKSNRITISAPQGGWAGVTDGIDAAGKPTHTEITAKFDGKDYPLKGVAPNTTRAFKRIDNHSFEFTTKVDGKVTTTTRVVVSPDGKTQTVTTTGKNAQGQAVNNLGIYEKQ
jgi:hypothetical protein